MFIWTCDHDSYYLSPSEIFTFPPESPCILWLYQVVLISVYWKTLLMILIMFVNRYYTHLCFLNSSFQLFFLFQMWGDDSRNNGRGGGSWTWRGLCPGPNPRARAKCSKVPPISKGPTRMGRETAVFGCPPQGKSL